MIPLQSTAVPKCDLVIISKALYTPNQQYHGFKDDHHCSTLNRTMHHVKTCLNA